MVQSGKQRWYEELYSPNFESDFWKCIDHLFAVFLCMCSLHWLCDHANFSWRIVKNKLFYVCGKAEIGWDQALLEIWKADIKSTLAVFYAPTPAETAEPLLLAVNKSWFLPLSNLL